MTYARKDDGDKTVLSIDGTLDEFTAPELRTVVDELVSEERQTVVLELSGLREIDASSVGVIVSLFKRVRAYGGQVNVVGLQGQPKAQFRLLRLDRVFPL